ncbi:beta strand repeat-containing protein, partial [Flavobacterium sp.]|uniref:beta strand repeat-containing protein n=1 Tax=Flavobacterium sp. TaxID=239 RepID=UPI002FDA518B
MKNNLLFKKASSLLFWSFALLFLLISGKGYGQGTLSSPIFSENFGTLTNATALSTSNTAFSFVRIGTSSGSFTNQAVAKNPFAVSGGSGSSALLGAAGASITTIDKTALTSFTSGTFTFKFLTPSSLTGAVMLSAVGTGATFGSANGFTGAQLSAAFQVAGTNLQVRESGAWTTVQTVAASTSYTVTLVFNNTAGTLTYGSSKSLPSNKVDVWVNGSYVNQYSAATASLAASAFRIYCTTTQFEIDDVAVYNSLPALSVTAPGAPSITAVNPLNGQLSVAFTAPGSNGGAAISDYTYSTDGTNYTLAGTTSSPIVISGLTNGTTYSITLKAVNSVGAGSASGAVNGTPRTTPSAPTITGITPGNNQLSVAFTPGSNGGSAITNYKYSLNGGSTFASAGSTTSPIVITGLTNGTSYNVQLLAVNAAGDGAASGTTPATPLTTASAPTITGITPSNLQLSVAFTAPSSNGGAAITDYKYSLNGGTTYTSAGTTTSPIVITGLTNGTSYGVRLLAVTSAGDGAATATTNATPRTTATAPVITGITNGNGQLSVAFTAPSSNGGAAITDYKYSVNGGSTFTASGSTGSPIIITGLTNGTTYDVQLLAVNAAGDGAASTTVQGTPAAPSAPTISVNQASVGAVSTTYGTASSAVSFNASGATLTDDITITAPAGFEVSTTSSSSGFAASQVLTQSAGAVASTTVYVRLTATATVAGSPFSGNISLTTTGADAVTVATTASTVSPKGLTITGLTGNDKTYDGTTTATVSGTATLVGVVNSDDTTLNSSSVTYAFGTAGAGSNKSITVLGYSLNGTTKGNYTLSQPTGITATINKADQTITAISTSETRTFGDPTYSVATSASSGLTVTYSSSVTGVASVALNGTVTINGAGSTVITASQAGDTNYNPATSVTQTLTVGKANQTITAITATVSKTFGDATYSVATTASSGLAVTYSSSATGVATVAANGTVTIVGAGSATITAAQAGNTNYNAATSVTQDLTVGKANQTITGLAATDTRATGIAPYGLTATAPGGTITYASSNPAVATISGSTVTIVAAGTTTITANQAGSTNYNPATEVSQTLTVTQASINLGQYQFASSLAVTSPNANLTYTNVSPSAVTGSTSSSYYNLSLSPNWGTVVNTGAYIQFSVTPSAGKLLTATSLTFLQLATAAGASSYVVRSSADSYSSNLGAGVYTTTVSSGAPSVGATVSLSGASFTDVIGTLTFRIYPYGNLGAGTGNWRIDNLTLNGYVSNCTGTVPSISAHPTTQAVCTGTTLSLSVTASDATAYQWRKDGVNISGATSSTYSDSTITSSDAGSYDVIITGSTACATITSNAAVITVNEAPTAVSITPASATICDGTIQQLTASSTYVAVNSLGTGTTSTSAAVTTSAIGPNPFQNYYGGVKQQMLVLASTLNTLGLSTGSTISALQLQMLVADNTYALSNLKVKLQNTTATSVSTTSMVTSGWSTVYSPASYTPTSGYTNIPFSSNFTWNGTNLLIEISYTNANTGATTATNTAYYSTTSFVSSAIYVGDNLSAATLDAYAASPSYTYSTRNNFKFSFTKSSPITWSPVTDLYTDSGATLANAYVDGTNSATVYAKPSTSVTYTATATANTCAKTNTVALTVNPLPTATITAGGAATFCDGGNVTLTANAGTSYLWSTGATTQSITVAASGNYTVKVTNEFGCFTTSAATTVTVTPNTTTTTTASVCDSYTWSVNGQTYTESGTHSVVTGCHTEVLNLTITPSDTTTTTASVCDSYTWSVNGQTYTESG